MKQKITRPKPKTVLPVNSVNWHELKLEFIASSYKQAKAFIRDYKDPEVHILSDQVISKHTGHWSVDKSEWEQEAVRLTMNNLKETKAAELKVFLEEESAIVKQMLNIVKIGLNSLIQKKKVQGKTVFDITSAKDFKSIIDGGITVLKYNRGKLGVPFDKEDEVIDKQINFNFDMVNLEDCDAEDLFKFFEKKNNGQTNKIQPNEASSERVLEVEATP